MGETLFPTTERSFGLKSRPSMFVGYKHYSFYLFFRVSWLRNGIVTIPGAEFFSTETHKFLTPHSTTAWSWSVQWLSFRLGKPRPPLSLLLTSTTLFTPGFKMFHWSEHKWTTRVSSWPLVSRFRYHLLHFHNNVRQPRTGITATLLLSHKRLCQYSWRYHHQQSPTCLHPLIKTMDVTQHFRMH